MSWERIKEGFLAPVRIPDYVQILAGGLGLVALIGILLYEPAKLILLVIMASAVVVVAKKVDSRASNAAPATIRECFRTFKAWELLLVLSACLAAIAIF